MYYLYLTEFEEAKVNAFADCRPWCDHNNPYNYLLYVVLYAVMTDRQRTNSRI